MPEISRFYGIVIKMFFDDHNPPQPAERLAIRKAARVAGQGIPLDAKVTFYPHTAARF